MSNITPIRAGDTLPGGVIVEKIEAVAPRPVTVDAAFLEELRGFLERLDASLLAALTKLPDTPAIGHLHTIGEELHHHLAGYIGRLDEMAAPPDPYEGLEYKTYNVEIYAQLDDQEGDPSLLTTVEVRARDEDEAMALAPDAAGAHFGFTITELGEAAEAPEPIVHYWGRDEDNA